MSSADLNYSNQNRETTSLERQTMRADQCSIVNSKTAGHRISRIADWISRKVNLAGNVLARYRSIDSSADNSTLLLASAIKPGDEPQAIDPDIQHTKQETNISVGKSVESFAHNNSPVRVQRTINDPHTTESENSSSKELEFKSPAKRIATRVNESGLIRGAQIQRKVDQAMGFTSERMTTVNRLLQRSSLTDKQDLPVISADLSSQQESKQFHRIPSEGQSGGDRITNEKTAGVHHDPNNVPVSGISERIYRHSNSNESSLNNNTKPVFNNPTAISQSEIQISGKSESPLLFRSTDVSGRSEVPTINGEKSGIPTQKQKSPLLQTEITTEPPSDIQNVFLMPTHAESRTATEDSLSTIPNQVRRDNGSNAYDEHPERIFRSPDAGGPSIGDSAGSTLDKNSITAMNSPKIKVSGKDDGTLVYRSINVPETGHVTNRLLSRAAGSNIGNQLSQTAYNREIPVVKNVTGIIARALKSGSTEHSRPLSFRKENRSFSDINNEGAVPVSASPVVEANHSTPVDFIWRKSDSVANAHTSLAAGGVKDIRTITGSTLSRKEESGAGSGQGSQPGTVSENKPSTQQNVVIDIEEIAEQLERLLSRRMIIERERRGEHL